MNRLDLKSAKDQIGLPAFKQLEELGRFLGNPLGNDPRLAQSIITRSEAELFGLSSPRFAVRIRLRKGGFVNCRRMAMLARLFHQDNNAEWGGRYIDEVIDPSERNPSISEDQLTNVRIEEVLREQSCIADSLLLEPERLGRLRFSYIDTSRCKLVEAYGEESREWSNSPPIVMPYTKNMNLGGGLCAQAALFMATAMLAHYSKSVHGIAEITALCHDDHCRELSLGSLSPESMARFFDQIDLRLSEQCLTKLPTAKASGTKVKKFASAIRCYLQSGMPVIVPVSMKKLARVPSFQDSIYGRNGLEIQKFPSPAEINHVVLIVGYTRPLLPMRQFVLNDPATMPFLVATGKELHDVGAVQIDEKLTPDNGVFLAATPKSVVMPLLEERTFIQPTHGSLPNQREGFAYGLDLMSRLFHSFNINFLRATAKPNHVHDRFQLIRSAAPSLDWRLSQEPNRSLLECGLLRAIAELGQMKRWQKNHWLWIELFPDQSIWIWDAEQYPLEEFPDDRREFLKTVASEYLLGVVHMDPQSGEAIVEL